jgi:tetratricopeptide (TPR) repeat protein
MPQDRRRHVVRDAFALLAAGVLLALCLEGGARLLGLGAPERPELPAKRPGVFRILALGGSTVLGVPDGDVGFATQLALGLSELARGRPVELLNLARSGAPSAEVRDRLEATLSAEPDLLIVLTGHNEFLAARPGAGLGAALQRLRDGSQLVRALLAPFGSAGAGDASPAAPVPSVDPALRERVSREFRANLDAIVALAVERGVPLLLCTAPANRADWPPAHRHLAPTPGGPDPLRALADYRRGEALRAEGRFDAARESFARALELDPVPRRAFREFNDAVRAKAGLSGVSVVDLARRFERAAAHGLVGFEWIADNCHPTPRGNALIARELALAMLGRGLLLAPDAAVGAPAEWLARARRRQGGAEEQARAQLRWLLSNAIYSMKTPFFNFEASRRYLEQARALAPNDWRIHANLGTLSLLEGDETTGRSQLARARQLKGEPLDPRDRHLTPYLAEALAGGLAATSAGGS